MPPLLLLAFFATPGSNCMPCHPAEVKAHARTRHADAMMPAGESEFVLNLPANRPLHESEDGYSFLYRRSKGGVEVMSFQGDLHAEGVIEWVMGSGEQGQTPLVRSGTQVRESRVSYFPALHQYGVTMGQHPGASSNPQSALGLLQSRHDLENCLGCHATAITSDLKPAVPGVQCERCHAGAGEHALDPRRLPSNPGKLSADAQARFCGTCHRVKPPGTDADPDNIRFQPLRLMMSKCFASGKLACLTCHPAHQDARRNDLDYYNAKCQSCHAPNTIHADSRRQGNCIGCHMPRGSLHPALNFTDHFIRIDRSAYRR